MMFMRSGSGVGASAAEYSLGPIVLPPLVPPKTVAQLAPFQKSARPILRNSGIRGLADANPGVMSGLTIIGLLGLASLGLWAFSGKKHHRRR
jgi:hypothetical protein